MRNSKELKSEIYLGYCEGFCRPTLSFGNIMHIDSMVVYKSRVNEAKARVRAANSSDDRSVANDDEKFR